MAAKGNGRNLLGWAGRRRRARSFLYESIPQTAPRPISSWFFGGPPIGDAGGIGTATGVAAWISSSAGAAAGTAYASGAAIPPLTIGRAAIIQLSWRSGAYPVDGTITTPATDLTVSSINTTTDALTVTAHGIVDYNGDGPLIWHTDGGTVPAGLTEGAAYYAIIIDANTLKLATTDINATTSTAVNITSAGSGTHYLLRKQDTQINDSMFLVFGVRGTWDIVDVDPQPSLPPFDSYGNTLIPVGASPVAYAGWPNSKLGLYVSPSRGSVGGSAHTVSLNYGPYTTGGFEADEATVGFVEIQGPADLLAYSHVERTAAATITSASITIAKPARLIAMIGGNSGVGQHHAFTFLGGFTKIPGACAEAEITSNGYIQISTAELFVDPGGVATAYTFSANGTSSEGGQMWLLAFAEPDIGAAAGSSTVTGVGGAVAAAAGSSAGAASVTADGTAVAAASGSASGAASADGVAASSASPGSSEGVATATGVGTAITSAAGTSSGAATVAGAGAATAASAGAASGTSTAGAIGSATVAGAGAASATATDAAAGRSTASSAGAASGAASVAGVGAATVAGAGASAGTATDTGVGAAVAASSGTATGAASVSAASSAGTGGAGAASGSGTAAGASATIVAGTGTATGTGSAAAVAFAGVPRPLPDHLIITDRGGGPFIVAAFAGDDPFTVAPATDAALEVSADAMFAIGADPGPFAVTGNEAAFTVTAAADAPFTVEEI